MKIIGLGADATDGGMYLNVKLFVPSNEELQASDISVITDLVKEFQERSNGGRGTAGNAPAETTSRRSRRGSAETAAAPSEPTDSSASDAGGASRRRRGSSDAGESQSSGTASDAGASTSTRRRRSGADTASPSEPEVPQIKDADLTKAASDCAGKLGKELVEDILNELGVKLTNQIPADKRQWFLDEIKKELAK